MVEVDPQLVDGADSGVGGKFDPNPGFSGAESGRAGGFGSTSIPVGAPGPFCGELIFVHSSCARSADRSETAS
jgi:hypothetical protein